jgi:hypothetical protein
VEGRSRGAGLAMFSTNTISSFQLHQEFSHLHLVRTYFESWGRYMKFIFLPRWRGKVLLFIFQKYNTEAASYRQAIQKEPNELRVSFPNRYLSQKNNYSAAHRSRELTGRDYGLYILKIYDTVAGTSENKLSATSLTEDRGIKHCETLSITSRCHGRLWTYESWKQTEVSKVNDSD